MQMGSAATVEDILATAQAEPAAEPESAAGGAVETEEDIVNVRTLSPSSRSCHDLPWKAFLTGMED